MHPQRGNYQTEIHGYPVTQIDQTYIVRPIETRPNLRISYCNRSRGTGLCVDVKVYEWESNSFVRVHFFEKKDNFTLTDFVKFIQSFIN